MTEVHAIVFLAAVLYGSTGFGFGLVSLPLLTRILEPSEVAPLITLVTLPLSILLFFEARRWVRPRLVLPLLGGAAFGAPLGGFLLGSIPPASMRLAVGVTVALLAVVLLRGWSHPFEHARWGSFVVGALAGLLGTLMAIPGPPVLLFLANQQEEKNVFRANLIAFFLGTSVLSLIAYGVAGLVDRELVLRGIELLPATLVGVAGGLLLARRISEKAFRTCALLLVLLSGLALLV